MLYTTFYGENVSVDIWSVHFKQDIWSVHFKRNIWHHLDLIQGTPKTMDFVPLEQCFKRRHSRRKTNVFLKSPHLNLASKDFKEAKQSNCFSADSLPVESAQCLRLGDPQTEFKMSTKPLLKFYCALSTGKESAETELLNLLL